MAMIATIIVSTEPSRSAGFRNAPTSRSCALVIQPGDARGISCCSPNSALRKADEQREREDVERRGDDVATRRCRPSARRAVADSREAADTWLPLRREQRHGQDALLRRHAAVQERAAIPALILPQLRRIDEEAVARREQRVRAQPAPRQLERVLVLEQQRETPDSRRAGPRRTCSGGSASRRAWRTPSPACGSGSSRDRS